jgi:signal transduction histidine kinase
VSVGDRGPGFRPEDLPACSTATTTDGPRRRKHSGLGLGLFIAKGLAEAHGGRLTVESAPGVGTTFRLWLPAAGRAPAPAVVTAPA